MKTEENQIRQDVVFSARDLLVILFRFRYRMLMAFTATTLALIALPLSKPPVYEANSTLLIKIGREFRNRTEVDGGRQLMISQDGIINSEIQVLTSLDSVKKVINTIKLENLYPELVDMPDPKDRLEAAALNFTRSLTVQEVKNSNVIEISFKHQNPQLAALGVNLMVEAFKEKHLEVFSDADTAFIENQLAHYQSKLLDSGNSLQKFKERNGIVSQEEQARLLLTRAASIESEKIEVENRINALASRVPVLKSRAEKVLALGSNASEPGTRRPTDEAEARLLNMQLEEEQLLASYPPSSPLVPLAKERLAAVKASLKELEARRNRRPGEADPAYRSAEAELVNAETELKAQRAKLVALQEEGKSVSQRIQLLEQSSEEIQRLKRQQEIDEKNYQAFVARAEEARISNAMDRLKLANVSVIQKASVPVEPVEPKVVKVLLLGLGLGLAAGVGLAIVSEFYTPGLATPQAVERRLGLKVLLSIRQRL
ncbi:GumC family protein [Geomonas oryzae]|uniref:GumC family protein n=1 Tax=Geomonas oryzae TaxID=2364273 RepID=UPI00100BD8F7|nr:GNVR domain-containing protein [Geomonas oryzae]